MAKRAIPADRLCVIKLEDGLGWEQICPFLDMPIPKEEYPRSNETEKFAELIQLRTKPAIQRTVLRLAAIMVPTLGVMGWAAIKYGSSVSAAGLKL